MKKIISSWIGIFVGCTILAAGFVYFINPYNLVPGGVYGASIVLHNLFPSIQVGTFGYMFDIPLLIISVLVLGAKLGARTIVAALFTPLAMNVLSLLSYPSEEALHQLDPTQLLGGSLNMSDHLMLTSVIGAVVIGIGCGIVVRSYYRRYGYCGDDIAEILPYTFFKGDTAGRWYCGGIRPIGYRFRYRKSG